MNDLLGVIFSRDRAMQLDAVLRSFFLHCHDADNVKFLILYKTTSKYHEKQYQQLMKKHSGRVIFKEQQDFRQDILMFLYPYEMKTNKNFRWLSAVGRLGPPIGTQLDRIWRRTFSRFVIFLSAKFMEIAQKDQFILFLVDDNIFVQDFVLREAIDTILSTESILGFSLRLGENTTYDYSKSQMHSLPEFENIDKSIICFDWTTAAGNFGYPLEVSSSIYRLSDILPLLLGISFDNPNVLEERLAYHAKFLRKQHPQLACYQHSVTFCNPINLVQSVMPNRAGEKIKYDIDILSSMFERGDRIKVDSYSGFIPRSCHQEVELVFENLGDEL